MSDTDLLIDIMRHGEPRGGIRYRGHQDDPLSEAGWSQMRAAVAGESPWDQIVTSPLLRCREFAESLGQELGVATCVADAFKEMSFGEWEGLLPDEVEKRYPEILRRYWRDPLRNTPPNAEPLADFQLRVETAWKVLLAENQGRHLLLVAHGGVIRVVLCQVLGIPLERLMRIETPFANRSRVRVRFDSKGRSWQSLVHHGAPG